MLELELSTITQIQSTARNNGVQPLHPSFPVLVWVRRLLGWQTVEFNGRIWCRAVPLTNLQHGEIVILPPMR
jgi:hypothetical protein